MKVLVIDVGGTNVKLFATKEKEIRKLASGTSLTPKQMVEAVLPAVQDWNYEVVSIGYPGPVENDRPAVEPFNLGPGWVGFDFAAAFGKPVKAINDAAMQALGSYSGGRMLFLGLGTGLGSAMIVERVIVPLELAHLPYRKGRTFEDYVGVRGLNRLGKRKWLKAVADVVSRLKAAMQAHTVVLGGGNAKKLRTLPEGATLGDNRNAFLGGFRLWGDYEATLPDKPPGG
jgi:predicted NBD/HSP70 family sugar kinase